MLNVAANSGCLCRSRGCNCGLVHDRVQSMAQQLLWPTAGLRLYVEHCWWCSGGAAEAPHALDCTVQFWIASSRFSVGTILDTVKHSCQWLHDTTVVASLQQPCANTCRSSPVAHWLPAH